MTPWPLGPLTGGSLSVVPGVYVPFALAPLSPCHFLHAVNLGDAQLGIESKVHFPSFDGQVAVVPVPQLLQVLVVKDVEGVVPRSTEVTVSIAALSLCSLPPAGHPTPVLFRTWLRNTLPLPIRDLVTNSV